MINVCLLDYQKESSAFNNTIYEHIKSMNRLVNKLVKKSLNVIPHSEKYDVFVVMMDTYESSILDFIETIYRENEMAYFVFVLKKIDNISKLIRPSIRPSAILECPVERNTLLKVFEEIKTDQELRLQNCRSLSLKTSGEVFEIPLSTIFYIEASNKKMIIKTYGQEIEFYSTFKELKENLDESFLRCHKGFMVNSNKIKKVSFPKSTIVLTDDSEIPISRGYKDNVKKWIEEKV